MPKKSNSSRRRGPKFFKRDENKIYFNGTVVETLPGPKFAVEVPSLKENQPAQRYVCSLLNAMINKSKILLGDPVAIEIDPYNLDNARIIGRLNVQPRRQ
ncbi:MAG: hypothetical protein OHK0017_02300 [Patescibacteria group bacterium]